MLRTSLAFVLVLLAPIASGCTVVGDQIERAQDGASEVAERARFCFAVTRTLTSLDGGASLAEASDAAEEVLAQAPEELRADATIVADRLREAADSEDPSGLSDPEFREAAERLRDGTRELCDPTG
jgi:hypothetical protein